MPYDVEIQDRPAMSLASVRRDIEQTEIGQWVDEALQTIGPAFGVAGTEPGGPPVCVYHTWSDGRTLCEVGIPLDHPVPGLDHTTIEAGPSAVTMHVGPYDRLTEAHEAIRTWLEQEGRTAGDLAYEVYLDDPSVTAPEAVRTEVVWPLS